MLVQLLTCTYNPIVKTVLKDVEQSLHNTINILSKARNSLILLLVSV